MKRFRVPPNKVFKQKLFAKDPHCHWCGVLTRIVPQNPSLNGPPDMATLDHIITRNNRVCRAEYHSDTNRVLACYRCNKRRNDEDMNAMKCRHHHMRREVPDYL